MAGALDPTERQLTIGMRPEHLILGPGLDLTIDLVEPLGSETLVHGHSPGARRIDGGQAGRAASGGEHLSVTPRAEHLHVFDGRTGLRIDPIGAENVVLRLAAADIG